MSNGGYKGASPARETSPEQYPGVWELTEQFQAQADGNWPFQETDCAPKSLRFNHSDAAHLSRAFASAGNRQSWTWSGWAKRSKFSSTRQVLFSGGVSASNTDWLEFGYEADSFYWTTNNNTSYSTAKFRDPSAWHHVVVTYNGSYLKWYSNGVEAHSVSKTGDLGINGAWNHAIGKSSVVSGRDFGGYLADVYFIDGQVLEPTDFAFYDGQGLWMPKRFTGDYASSSTPDTTDDVYAWGLTFNNVTGGGGWYFTTEDDASSLGLTGNTGGHADELGGNTIGQRNGESTAGAWGTIASLNGYTAGQAARSMSTNTDMGTTGNQGGPISFVWNKTNGKVWVIGNGDTTPIGNGDPNNPASTPTFLLPTTGKVAFGFVSANSTETVTLQAISSSLFSGSHTLPKWRGVYDHTLSNNNATSTANAGGYRDVWSDELNDNSTAPAVGRNSFKLDFSDGVKDQSGRGNDWTPNNIKADSIGGLVQDWESMLTGAHDTNHGWGTLYGSDNMFDGALNTYTIGQANATGLTFTPTSPLGASATTIRIYGMDDNCPDSHLKINGVNYGGLVNSGTTWTVLKGTGAVGSGITSITSIYLRDNSAGNQSYRFAALEIDGVIITQGSTADLFVDSPVNGNEASTGAGNERRGNYCTLNPLSNSAFTMSNGNLSGSSQGYAACLGTIAYPKTGKWYYEFSYESVPGYNHSGIATGSTTLTGQPGYDVDTQFTYWQNGSKTDNVAYGASFAANDVIGVAFDADAGSLVFYKNGVSQGVNATGLTTDTYFPYISAWSYVSHVNFGQRPFSHPVTGYSPLATSFLPEPSESAKHPHKGVDVALFNANNGVSQFIPLSFSPDLVWTKSRAGNYEPQIFDKVRGDDQEMSTNVARASRNLAGSFTFNDDGFTLPGSNNNANYGTGASMAWAWDGGEATTSIAAGDSNSSAYDQSQAWSAGMKTSVAATTSYITTGRTTNFDLSFTGKEPFNADLTDFLYGKTGVAGTWIYLEFATALTNVTSIAFSTEYSCPSGIIKLNGTDVAVDKADLAGGFVEVNVTGAIPSSLTEIAIQGVGGSARLKYMKINGKYLIDRINDSQTWSSSTFFNANGHSFYNTNGTAAQIFDNVESGPGSTGDFALPVDGGTFTLTFSQFSSATTVELEVEGTGNALKINGSFVTIPSGSPATATYSVSGLTTIEWLYNGASNYCYLGSIKVGDVKLVNPGVRSLTNVPTIATTVRANPSYGFSISKASVAASLTGGPTVAHGLQKKPEFIIGKNIDSTIYWYAYHKDLTNEHYLIPHLTSGEQHSNAVWGNHDSLDANQIQIGAGTPASMWIPSGTHDCIFYAWTSIEGFSKIGSFINPSSSDGAFVYLGFKPALIFAKCAINISSSNNLGDWVVKDSSRSPFNNPSDGNTLIWNEAYAEDGYYSASQVAIDILSNGFKIRHPGSSPLGDPGRRYVFAAWAENPFASNNRAV